MKIKVKKLLLLIALFLMLTPKVNAKEYNFFVNANGVEMNETEYNNIIRIHGESFVNQITQKMFESNKEYYSNPDISIEIKESDTGYRPYSTIFDTNYKTLKIATISSQTSSKLVVVTLSWKTMPKVKSYDVIGVRLVNTQFDGNITTLVSFDGSSSNIAGSKKFNNGYGASVKLKEDCSSIKLQQSFKASAGGTVYGSYQHAVRNISLSDSQNFTISSNGLGGVFKFNNNDLFDKMSGVYISI